MLMNRSDKITSLSKVRNTVQLYIATALISLLSACSGTSSTKQTSPYNTSTQKDTSSPEAQMLDTQKEQYIYIYENRM